MKKVFILLLMTPYLLLAQDDLLGELESEVQEDNTVEATFKGLKIVNFETTKLVSKRNLFFVVSHRFGSVENGIDDFFGLDQAVTQLKFIYGINDGFNVGIARSSFQKTYGVHAKYRLLRQKKDGFPVTIVGYNLLTINTALEEDVLPKLEFSNRLSYTTQVLISRKINKNLSLELAPSYLHENFVRFDDQDNSQFIVGMGGRYKLTKRFSLNIDYGVHLNRSDTSTFKNPLSIGVDIETGGHIFQLHFTNAQPMFENGFLGQASGDWGDGDFFFGFNLSRVFDL
ncbi:DUF5777 family beta-barrel protein [Aquimarina sp. 2201CG5-10]|uniref:DUF5777 family beta-barrel protein n=1 Tax=Aquimarina callyspongiae TaxID=3098150 RepID=UPI002AB3BC3A|nr:DUF5777 family beta-barrel protein [Aquimarina sp. 2201CG5-10]MDY8138876.1 DUF5777 family beta-barrel protein [Aquimarina sp. 2201CG5-10]